MLEDVFRILSDFMKSGGTVLWVVFVVTFALWSLIAERMLFLRYNYPLRRKKLIATWNQRRDQRSWTALRVREQLLSSMSLELRRGIPLIRTLVTVCPLLGLLGTVTGMIAVFDVMAVVGTGNARSMASGISMATIPTMAGMVAALSGIYFRSYLEKRTQSELEKLTDELIIQ